jgi:hypothetical protein
MLTRRNFLATSASTLIAAQLRGQSSVPDVEAFEHARILAAVPGVLAKFDAISGTTGASLSLLELNSITVALTAAFLVTKDEKYAKKALNLVETLRPLDINLMAGASTPQYQLSLLPLAEFAVALRFLVDSMSPDQLSLVSTVFTDIQGYLNTDGQMAVERDCHDHRASAWLLLSTAIARYQRDEKTLDANRRLFRKPTLRNQINQAGQFPEELATPNPYRNSLFNFDLLCGACQLLASPFDPLWDYELIDGIGLRVAAATLYPVIVDRRKWPAVSDAEHFRDLPGRRPGLLFAGHAYKRPEYVDLWRSLSPEIPPALADSFPIREPLLWISRAQHGL